jgi:hypothetical protein
MLTLCGIAGFNLLLAVTVAALATPSPPSRS